MRGGGEGPTDKRRRGEKGKVQQRREGDRGEEEKVKQERRRGARGDDGYTDGRENIQSIPSIGSIE